MQNLSYKPEKTFERILKEIHNSSQQAYQYYEYLMNNNWKSLLQWISDNNSQYLKRLILKTISELINQAVNDCMQQNSDQLEENKCKQDNINQLKQKNLQEFKVKNQQPQQINQIQYISQRRPPLQNITNSSNNINQPRTQGFTNQIYRHDDNQKELKLQNNQQFKQIVSSLVIEHKNYQQKYFSKDQLLGLVLNKNLIELLKNFGQQLANIEYTDLTEQRENRLIYTKIIYQVAEIILQNYKKQKLYDEYALKYLNNGIFNYLMQFINKSPITLPNDEIYLIEIARTLEFCSTHNDGIKLLFKNKENIFQILSYFFKDNSDELTVLYASATVLLDLTANEVCIEQVAQLMKQKNMFHFIVSKLHYLMDLTLQSNFKKDKNYSQYQKLRDLFIGIVLNLTCNVENISIIQTMIKEANMISALIRILIDSRHDWPTNGASLALLQYSHLSMQEGFIFSSFQQNQVETILKSFIDKCKSREAKKNMYETITIIDICLRKIQSILYILEKQTYAACA